ncbi:disease resistance protein RML1B-like [Lotus japonicus]|uniref:disease resistance protein RML1B-like n=1 Tax=Lotus japonicus TaxID=34305 RepID=UPI00258489AC|nr:disease resistance protein RML1B-like [Lotus japonicus]XP_057456642.1 disease resistance protein RML1B-like [Lotus japonicus]XP_057456643.1 disease resistance protein RML1B-like [Lotus japonicus]XP_057456644.1 disease resistance protein RML1B-like [Lotus japonicus]
MASSSGASQIKCAVLVACITGCILLYFRVKKKRQIIKKDIVVKSVEGNPMSNNSPQIYHDVFVSFRGEDIRHGFLSHLTKAFIQKQIQAFVDDKLKRGDDISSSLFEAIEGSSISLIIFSENYASSHWCLEELVKILECKEKHGQIVIPVFYKVDPSDVRHQRNSYESALTEHEKKYNLHRVQIWRQALNKSANLSGINSLNFQNDADLLEEVINHVSTRLMPKHPINTKGLIGMEKPSAHLESLLCRESKEARVIGIWGMGGIGKTTVAEEIFNKKCFEYERSCFLEKVNNELQKDGIRSLKEKLLSTLLAENVKIDTPNRLPSDIKRRIGRTKVLIVLDDVNDIDLVESIFGTLDWLHAGSIIMITTRDKQVLISNKAHDIYHVEELSFSEALQLFNLNAFDQSHLEKGYYDLSQRLVNYAKGVPLVLKVLGRLLRGRSRKEWESQLDKLTKGSVKEVHDLMRLSYDNLDRREQQILLDVACFFNGMKMKMRTLLPLLKDHENDNSGVVGLERLKDRALVTISKDNIVSMHDIIQEMGREIVRQESKDPGQRSRLWDHNDIYEVFKYNKGTEAIRSIWGNFSEIRNLDLSPDVFVKMSKLQFLCIYEEGGTKCRDLFSQCRGLLLSLKYLIWTGCSSWPQCFSPESLVILVLYEGKMQRLWHGVQNLVNLKAVFVERCSFLEELPDFSKAINLEFLSLCDCVKLKSVHPSIYSLDMLLILNLEGCKSLTEFTSDTRLSSLLSLNLTSCTSLRKLSLTSENITHLYLEGIPANVLPSSFACQSKLGKLVLRGTEYERLPACITNLTRLLYLDLTSCAKLQSIPVLPPSLEVLFAGGCRSLKTIFFPSTAAEQFKENKKFVFFDNCWNLDERSLWGIELNAQINLMKLTYQHPFAPVYDDQVDKYENGFVRAIYEYPGCIVPKWMEYKTTKGDMIIDLGRAPLLGFIFCFILAAEEDPTEVRGEVKFEITIIDGEGEKGCVMISWISTDNVFLIYDKKCSDNIISATNNQTRFKIKVAILEVRSIAGRVMNWKIKEFGVSPINTLIYDSFRHLARNCECDAAEASAVVHEQARENPGEPAATEGRMGYGSTNRGIEHATRGKESEEGIDGWTTVKGKKPGPGKIVEEKKGIVINEGHAGPFSAITSEPPPHTPLGNSSAPELEDGEVAVDDPPDAQQQ